MERSLVLVKPDAMERGLGGAVIARLQQRSLKLVALKMLRMDKPMARRHYAVHEGKPFFDSLVEFITSAPIIASIFDGEGAIEDIRRAMGSTDPARAEPGTIRADFGLDIQRNATHASDSAESARTEVDIFFSEDEIFG